MAQKVIAQEMLVRPLQVEVSSQSNPGESYTVTLAHCNCKDFRYRKGTNDKRTCKHIEEAYATVAGWHGRPVEPQVFTALRRPQAFAVLVDTDLGDLTTNDANGLLDAARDFTHSEFSRMPEGGKVEVDYDRPARCYKVTLQV